jgi:hypothetical protein
MAEVLCQMCGSISDSRALACAHCRRCICCGRKLKEQSEECPSCRQPHDAQLVAVLESSLDPKLPRNRWLIRWGERNREGARPVNYFRVIPAVLVIVAVIVLAIIRMQSLIGYNDRRESFINFLSCMATLFALISLRRRGWFRWVLRK